MNCRINLSPNGECTLPYRCGKKRVTCCGMCKEVERCGKRCIWLGGGAGTPAGGTTSSVSAEALPPSPAGEGSTGRDDR